MNYTVELTKLEENLMPKAFFALGVQRTPSPVLLTLLLIGIFGIFIQPVKSTDYDNLKKIVVGIKVNGQATANGFLFRKDKDYIYILTCNHVVEDVDSVKISVKSVDEDFEGEVCLQNETYDFALVKVSIKNNNFPLDYFEYLKIDTTLKSEFENKKYKVIINSKVSGKSRPAINVEITDTENELHSFLTSKPLEEGYSGSPVFDGDKIIGMVTRKDREDNGGMCYMLPVNKLISVLNLVYPAAISIVFLVKESGTNNPIEGVPIKITIDSNKIGDIEKVTDEYGLLQISLSNRAYLKKLSYEIAKFRNYEAKSGNDSVKDKEVYEIYLHKIERIKRKPLDYLILIVGAVAALILAIKLSNT